jgi:hypothetical protein
MVCLRNISVDTLHKGSTEDNNNNNNNNNNNTVINNNCGRFQDHILLFKISMGTGKNFLKICR